MDQPVTLLLVRKDQQELKSEREKKKCYFLYPGGCLRDTVPDEVGKTSS